MYSDCFRGVATNEAAEEVASVKVFRTDYVMSFGHPSSNLIVSWHSCKHNSLVYFSWNQASCSPCSPLLSIPFSSAA